MRTLKRASGVTLLELLIAVAMTVSGVLMITMMVPKVSKSSTNNRHQAIAMQFAASKLAELRAMPYHYIPLTPEAQFGAVANCNCAALDMSTLPTPDATMIDKGIEFQRRVCITLADRPVANWTSQCPDSPLTPARDKGLKFIRVQTSWQYAGTAQAVYAQSMVVNP